MGLSDQAARLEEYHARIERGEADRITPSDVDRIVAKLERKQIRLRQRLQSASTSAERDRRRRKLAKTDQLLDQARWLRTRL
jgi:hypothetical protein